MLFTSIEAVALENPIVEECNIPQILSTNKGIYISLLVMFGLFLGEYFV